MNRPPLEVADLVRAAGRAFVERSRRWINWQHLKVLRAIVRCRTAALGGHLDECTPTAGTVRPSPTTAAVTGTARSVKPTPATVGSKRSVLHPLSPESPHDTTIPISLTRCL